MNNQEEKKDQVAQEATKSNQNPNPAGDSGNTNKKDKKHKQKKHKQDKYQGNPKKDEGDKIDQTSDVKAHNDPRIWGTEEQVRACASWSYSNRLGLPIQTFINGNIRTMGQSMSGLTTIDESTETIPGVCTLDISFAPGVSVDGSSPVNVSAYIENGFMRSNVSGSRAYSKQDFSAYLLHLDSAYAIGAFVQRAILTAMNWKRYNVYYVLGLFKAYNIDFDDLNNNMANYIARWNNVRSKLNQFSLPQIIGLTQRHTFMMQNLYLDDPDIVKAQVYAFYPRYSLMYDPVNNVMENREHSTSSVNPLSYWLTLLETYVQRIADNSKFAQISGDVEKAYGTDSVMSLPQMPTPAPIIEPVYDVEMLYTIHHTRICGGFGSDVSGVYSKNMFVDTNQTTLPWIFNPTFESTNAPNKINLLRNSFYDSANEVPSADENMTNSRLDVLCDWDSARSVIHLKACGTEICHYVRIIFFNESNVLQVTTLSHNIIAFTNGTTLASQVYINELNYSQCFKRFPLLFKVIFTGGVVNPTAITIGKLPFNEIKNTTVLDADTVERAHTQACLAMFAIPDGSRVLSRNK